MSELLIFKSTWLTKKYCHAEFISASFALKTSYIVDSEINLPVGRFRKTKWDYSKSSKKIFLAYVSKKFKKTKNLINRLHVPHKRD